MEQPEEQDTSYITMADVLKEQEDLEETSGAVLGASDDKNCTYPKGYVNRQALFACLTCAPEARADESKRSGICFACSLQCHDNHELLELYTKRQFRCDCGGKRMPDVKCKLEPRKEEENSRNRYNQNFAGLYCICHRPYPDPETDVADEMLQCIACEDWYHLRHLEVAVGKNVKSYAEMVCGGCMEALPFLKHYAYKIEDPNSTLDNTIQVDVTGLDESASVAPADEEAGPSEPKRARRLDDSQTAADGAEEKAKSTAPPDALPALDICTKPPLDSDTEKRSKKEATFWVGGWRKSLCQCKQCAALYKEHAVEFLLDPEDTVQHYEEVGKRRLATEGSAYQMGMEMLGQLDRGTQVNMLTEYNRMKERLLEFLDPFVSSQQVVTQADITEFFSRLNRERRAETSSGAPPYFCR